MWGLMRADPSSKVPNPWASETSISRPFSVMRVLNWLPSCWRRLSLDNSESSSRIFSLSKSLLLDASPSPFLAFSRVVPPMSTGDVEPDRKMVGCWKYWAMASFWAAEVLEMIHSTRNNANIEVMKSAKATFHAPCEPPWSWFFFFFRGGETPLSPSFSATV